MDNNNQDAEVIIAPRRSQRLALSELNESSTSPETPNKSTSPDEMVIIQRGPRRKPLTWSPVECNRSKLLNLPRDKTPEKKSPKPDLNPRLRRRLIMSPGKTSNADLGVIIAKKLRSLQQDK